MKEEYRKINGKKMKRVKLGSFANYLLPWSDMDKNGVKVFKVLEWFFYKRNGKYYMEVPQRKEE